jgi:hypothetical protein
MLAPSLLPLSRNFVNKINLNEVILFSYQDLCGRLFSYCTESFNETTEIKIVVLLSEDDAGKGHASKQIFKQFGIYPEEILLSKNSLEKFDFSEIKSFKGISIILYALPVEAQVGNVINEIPVTLAKRTRELCGYLRNANNIFSGNVIFMSGSSVFNENTKEIDSPEASLIPWYMFIRDRDNIKRSYRQPELNNLLNYLDISRPAIDDLVLLTNPVS